MHKTPVSLTTCNFNTSKLYMLYRSNVRNYKTFLPEIQITFISKIIIQQSVTRSIAYKNLAAGNSIVCNFYCNIISLHFKIMRKNFINMISVGNQYIGYPVLLHLKQKFVFSSVSSLIYYILIKSYFILV